MSSGGTRLQNRSATILSVVGLSAFLKRKFCATPRWRKLTIGQCVRVSARRVRLQMVQSAAGFCNILSVYVEQEPGSGGKESAEATVRMLKGHRAYCDRVTGSKETRAEPFAAAVVGEGKNEGVVRRGDGVMCGDGVLAPTPQPFN
jgi:hypothetical protein